MALFAEYYDPMFDPTIANRVIFQTERFVVQENTPIFAADLLSQHNVSFN